MQGFLSPPDQTVLYFPIALMIRFMQVRPKPRHRVGLSFKPRAWKLGVQLHWVRIYIALAGEMLQIVILAFTRTKHQSTDMN